MSTIRINGKEVSEETAAVAAAAALEEYFKRNPEKLKKEHKFSGEDFEWVHRGDGHYLLRHKHSSRPDILVISAEGKLYLSYGCNAPGIQTDDDDRILLDEE